MDKPNAIFFIRSIGHDGGNWTGLCICNHPAQMSMLGELQKEGQLDLAGRGLTSDDRAEQTHKYIEDRIYYGDVAIGFYRWTWENVKYARNRVGKDSVRVVSRVRNPLYRFASKWAAKKKAGKRWFEKMYDREPRTEQEICEGCSAYFAENYFMKAIRKAERDGQPIVRLEDINRSMKKGGGFVKRHFEWLTKTEWPQWYIQHIHDNWTPGYVSRPALEWDDEGRVSKVTWTQWDEPRWKWRDNWDDDPRPAYHWNEKLTDWEKELYMKYHERIERILGYNQGEKGVADEGWAFRGTFPWGEV
jgi:hypothetical protein